MEIFNKLYEEVEKHKWKQKGFMLKQEASINAKFDFRINPLVIDNETESSIYNHITKLSSFINISTNEINNIIFMYITALRNNIILTNNTEEIKNMINETFEIFKFGKESQINLFKKVKYTIISENKRNFVVLNNSDIKHNSEYSVFEEDRKTIIKHNSFAEWNKYISSTKNGFRYFLFSHSEVIDNKVIARTMPLLYNYNSNKNICIHNINYFEFTNKFFLEIEIDLDNLLLVDLDKKNIDNFNINKFFLDDETNKGFKRETLFKKVKSLDKNKNIQSSIILFAEDFGTPEKMNLLITPFTKRRQTNKDYYNRDLDITK